jgi:carbon monoxide dehydrogenase subunit G
MADPVTVSSRVVVPAAPDQVWQAAVDWSGHHRWIIATCVYGDQGPGATVVGRTGIGPLGFTDTMVITRWEPPRRCVLHHIGPLVHGDVLFEVTPAGAGSQFSWTEQLQLPMAAAAHLAWPVIRRLLQRGMNMSLHRFARLFPPGAPPEPTARAEQVQDCPTRSIPL